MANKVVYLPNHINTLVGVVEESSVSDVLEAAIAEHPFAEDIFEAAKWRLAHDPDAGVTIEGTNPQQRLICIPSNRLAKSPTLLVRYRTADDCVTITWAKFLPFDESNAVTPDAYQL